MIQRGVYTRKTSTKGGKKARSIVVSGGKGNGGRTIRKSGGKGAGRSSGT